MDDAKLEELINLVKAYQWAKMEGDYAAAADYEPDSFSAKLVARRDTAKQNLLNFIKEL